MHVVIAIPLVILGYKQLNGKAITYSRSGKGKDDF